MASYGDLGTNHYFCRKECHMYLRKKNEDLNCGIYLAMKVFGSKWKPCIIDAINNGISRPSQIHREILSATPRVLDMQLKELEEYKVVEKISASGFPLKAEYRLTEFGNSILPILESLREWGVAHMDLIKEVHYGIESQHFISRR